MKSAPLFLMAALALAACRKDEPKKEPEEKSATAAQEKKKSATRPPPPPVDEGIDVPTEEDFEEDIAAQITEQTDLGKELDKLEKEIGK
jgi:hypothetical protein